MEKKFILKKCGKCGAIIRIIENYNNEDCGITCCGEKMNEVIANSTEAAFEKHIPTYEKDGDEIIVRVNHVMEQDHYIEWIAFVTDEKEEIIKFSPNQIAEFRFKYVAGAKLYSYCNKHGLWESCVE